MKDIAHDTQLIAQIKKDKNINDPREIDVDKSYVIKSKKNKVLLGIPSMVNISEERWGEIENDLKKIVEQVGEDKQGIVDKIAQWAESIQGIPEAGRTPPWDKACSVRDTLTATHCRTIETSINQTLGIDPPFIASVEGKENKPKEKKLAGLVNKAAKKAFNFEQELTKITKAAVRKCVAIVIPEWERKIAVSTDVNVYESLEEYKIRYPKAEDTNLTEAQYKAQLEVVAADICAKGYHECLYEYDEVVVNQPTITVASPAALIMHPWTSPTIDLAQLIGYKTQTTFGDLKMAEREGRYKNVDRIISFLDSEKAENDEDKRIKLENKGVSPDQRSVSFRDKILDKYKGLIRLDLYGDGIERDYEFVFVYEEESGCVVLVRLAPKAIHYWRRNYIPICILPEEDTIFGTAIPELLENPQAVLDALTRLVIDSNSIANTPMFKAAAIDKSNIGDTRKKGAIYPGRGFYLQHPVMMEFFRADRVNVEDFLSLIRYTALNAEVQTGASRTLAGQNLADDPEAPGVKTAMLIQRSSFMINEYIKNMRPGLGLLAKFIVKLYKQHLKYDERVNISIFNDDGNLEDVEVGRDELDFLESTTTFDVKNQRVEDNHQSRQQVALQDMQLLLSVPQIAENPMAVRTIVMNYLLTSPFYSMDEIEQIVPSMEKIQQMFRGVAQDVLAAERAQQEGQNLQAQNDQMAETQEQEITDQIQSEQ